jgi:hypothetical protein
MFPSARSLNRVAGTSDANRRTIACVTLPGRGKPLSSVAPVFHRHVGVNSGRDTACSVCREESYFYSILISSLRVTPTNCTIIFAPTECATLIEVSQRYVQYSIASRIHKTAVSLVLFKLVRFRKV